MIHIDKQNGDIAFNDELHLYFNTKYPDVKYTSVTTLIGQYHEKFDEEFWSRYKALEFIMGVDAFKNSGIKSLLLESKTWNDAFLIKGSADKKLFEDKVTEIKAGYKEANRVACENGTAYHLKKELEFYENKTHNMSRWSSSSNREAVCEKNNFDLNRESAVMPEYLIYYTSPCGLVNIAGQADLIIKDQNDIYCLDFKTNAKGIETKAFFNVKTKSKKKMFYPIHHIDDTTFNHYSIQLSIYCWMFQQINPNFNIKMLRLLHYANGVETAMDCPYLKDEAQALIDDQIRLAKINNTKMFLSML